MAARQPVFTVIGGPHGAGKSTLAAGLVENGYSIGRLIKERISFTRESTLTSSEILRAMEGAKQAGFTVNLIFIGIDSVETSKERVRARVEGGGHDVAEALQERRFERSFGNVAAAVKLADNAFLFDNRGAGHELVGEAQNGKVTRLYKERAPWIEKAMVGVERAPDAETPRPGQAISSDEAGQWISRAERLADSIGDPDRRAVALQHLDAMRRAAGRSPTQGNDEKDRGGDFEADAGEDG